MEPIDFVVTWVDNQDPEWQREKNEYSPQSDIDAPIYACFDNNYNNYCGNIKVFQF